ncbi:unnamed protein product [Ectocarpus sp. CCAP 1310/34]|nr:unnamed protein product [Ectocarpus sp. CCAP 1310/34]
MHVSDLVSSLKEPSFHKPDPAPSSTAADPNDGDGDKNVPAHYAFPTSTVTSSVYSPSESTSSDLAKAERKRTAAMLMIAELVHWAGDNPNVGDVVERARERHNLLASVHNGGETKGDDEGKDASLIHESISGVAAENQAAIQQEDQQDERHPKSDGSDDGNSNSKSSSNSSSSSSSSSSSNDNGNSNGNDKKGPTYSPDAFEFHPNFVLRVGDFLHGKLPNAAKTAMVYATSIDGSVVHATATGRPSGDLEDRTIETVSPTHVEAIEGRILKKSNMVTVLGFLPFGKHGFRRRPARKHAAAHIGEATLSVTNEGDLEVSVDGFIVLRKPGPSWFGFRQKYSTYEVRVTKDGVAVSQGGKYDLGIQAREPLAQVVPTTICFCDKYPDLWLFGRLL